MKVQVVTSAEVGCEPDCPEWIAAQGTIDASSPPQFKKTLRGLGERKLPVFIHSVGGSVRESLEIGRLLRAKGLSVAVSRTTFIPCAKTDDACLKRERKGLRRGLPQAFAVCASACAFILAGGTRRSVGPWTRVGVHQIRSLQTFVKMWRTYRVTQHPDGGVTKTIVSERKISEKTVEKKASNHTYDEVARYFAEMGIAKEIMSLVEATPHTSMHWLTRNELRSTGLATDYLAAGHFLPRPNRADNAASAPQSGAAQAAPPPAKKCDPLAREGFGCDSGQPWRPSYRAPQ